MFRKMKIFLVTSPLIDISLTGKGIETKLIKESFMKQKMYRCYKDRNSKLFFWNKFESLGSKLNTC